MDQAIINYCWCCWFIRRTNYGSNWCVQHPFYTQFQMPLRMEHIVLQQNAYEHEIGVVIFLPFVWSFGRSSVGRFHFIFWSSLYVRSLYYIYFYYFDFQHTFVSRILNYTTSSHRFRREMWLCVCVWWKSRIFVLARWLVSYCDCTS